VEGAHIFKEDKGIICKSCLENKNQEKQEFDPKKNCASCGEICQVGDKIPTMGKFLFII
jgi:hypothetical protein